MSWAPTTEQILNLDGVHQRADGFRFELCDRELRPIGELHPDRSGTVPSIENDATGGRRLSSFKLLRDELDDVNTLRDRLRVYMVLQNGVEFRLGTFVWGDANRPRRSWGQEEHGELVDLSHILNQQTTQAFGWGRGANIGLVMIFLMGRAGFELADIARIGDEANRGLAEPMAWQPSTTWIQMLTDLGDLVGFAVPWFDRDGRSHHDQPPDPDVAAPTVDPYEDGTRVIADSIVDSNDLLKSANDFALFDSGTGRLRIGRHQLPPNAPHSYPERGFRIGMSESVQGSATQAQLDRGARNLARTRGVAFEWLAFSSTWDPRHETWDVVPAFGRNWLETGFGGDLRSGGTMTHVMRRPSYEPI